jgi:hypothetical protein
VEITLATRSALDARGLRAPRNRPSSQADHEKRRRGLHALANICV